MTLRNLIKLEELSLFLLSAVAFVYFGSTIWIFFLTLFLPDISMIGYLVNSYVGAVTYNTVHFKGLAIIVFAIGMLTQIDICIFVGVILFAHSSLDRFLGYGLKYKDSFKNTSLGRI